MPRCSLLQLATACSCLTLTSLIVTGVTAGWQETENDILVTGALAPLNIAYLIGDSAAMLPFWDYSKEEFKKFATSPVFDVGFDAKQTWLVFLTCSHAIELKEPNNNEEVLYTIDTFLDETQWISHEFVGYLYCLIEISKEFFMWRTNNYERTPAPNVVIYFGTLDDRDSGGQSGRYWSDVQKAKDLLLSRENVHIFHMFPKAQMDTYPSPEKVFDKRINETALYLTDEDTRFFFELDGNKTLVYMLATMCGYRRVCDQNSCVMNFINSTIGYRTKNLRCPPVWPAYPCDCHPDATRSTRTFRQPTTPKITETTVEETTKKTFGKLFYIFLGTLSLLVLMIVLGVIFVIVLVKLRRRRSGLAIGTMTEETASKENTQAANVDEDQLAAVDKKTLRPLVSRKSARPSVRSSRHLEKEKTTTRPTARSSHLSEKDKTTTTPVSDVTSLPLVKKKKGRPLVKEKDTLIASEHALQPTPKKKKKTAPHPSEHSVSQTKTARPSARRSTSPLAKGKSVRPSVLKSTLPTLQGKEAHSTAPLKATRPTTKVISPTSKHKGSPSLITGIVPSRKVPPTRHTRPEKRLQQRKL